MYVSTIFTIIMIIIIVIIIMIIYAGLQTMLNEAAAEHRQQLMEVQTEAGCSATG